MARSREKKTYGVVLVRPLQRGESAYLRIERAFFGPGELQPSTDLAGATVQRSGAMLDLSAEADWSDVWQELFDLSYGLQLVGPREVEMWTADLQQLPARLSGAAEALCRSVAGELGMTVKEVRNDAQ